MKMRFIAAALAAFLLLPLLSFPAFATEVESLTELDVIAEDAPEAEESMTDETDTDETTDMDAEDLAALLSMFMLPYMSIADSDAPNDVVLPSRPPGTGTVIDYNTDPDGRLFYTIMTPDEHVFYLVIDKTGNTDNVYFLNAVTIADLAALAEIPAPAQGGMMTPNPPATELPTTETPPPPSDEPKDSGSNMGMYIFIIVLAVLGGGAGWYFKIYRPKQQGAASEDEYDPSMDESDNDYADDWGDDSGDESDEAPPWDEDGESADGEDE